MAKVEIKIARRYAGALFELCEPATLESMRDGLQELAAAWESNSQLRNAVLDPASSLSERSAVMVAVAEKIRPGDRIFKNFVSLLMKNKRIDGIVEVAKAFVEMVEEARKLLALQITTASALAEDERSALQKKIEGNVGKLVTIEWRVDAAVLGGMVVKSKDLLLDNSIQGSLEKMRAKLAA